MEALKQKLERMTEDELATFFRLAQKELDRPDHSTATPHRAEAG